MSKRLGSRSVSPGVRRSPGWVLALACSVVCGVPPTVKAEESDLERAYVDHPTGIAGGLSSRRDRILVRISTTRQPLLESALADGPRLQLSPTPRSPDSVRIEAQELDVARRNEGAFEASVAGLATEANRQIHYLKRLARTVESEGGSVKRLEPVPGAVVARIAASRLRTLIDLPSVQSIEPEDPAGRLSGIGTAVVGAPAWWAVGLTGGSGPQDQVPADAAIESEAADAAHPAFADITVDNDPSQAVTDHGTHTGGVIASGDTTYAGVAYGLDRLIGSGSTAYELGIATASGPGAADPAEVINVSFGSAATSDSEDNADDILTNVFGVGQAFGAGNENVDGTPTVGNIGRNVLTVGGFNDVGTVSSTDDVVLGVSSRGPTPGGRKKPDLTAPGGSVIAPSAAWNSPPSNPDFTAMSGTSFAAPHVAGAMTLLEGAGIGDPMAQRAILINSARDWNGASTGLDGWTPPQVGWRPEVGWGELDLTAALAERGNYRLGAVREGEAAYFAAPNVTTGSKATLAYELRGYFVGFPDPGTQTLTYTQSNLDLRQYLDDGTEVMPPPAPLHGGGPDAIDPNDTVEQVRAPAGGPFDVVYKVAAASTIEGAAAEPFAITAAAPLTALEPAVVQPTQVGAEPSEPVRCGQPVTIDTALVNDSDDLEATNARVRLETPGTIEVIEGDPEQAVSGGDLAPGETSESHAWTVRATADGHKHLTVTGSGGALETDFERSHTVTIEADCVPPATAIDAGPAGTVNDEAPRFTFSATGGGTFQCSVDDGPFQPCASPMALTGLADGDHAFAVRAVDGVGNVDPTPARRTFELDRRVLGVGLRQQSARVGPGARFLGSVRVRVGEPGTVKVRPSAVVVGGRLQLRDERIKLDAAGRWKLRLAVPRDERRRLRRALAGGRPVAVVVIASFEDAVGNSARRRTEFAIGR